MTSLNYWIVRDYHALVNAVNVLEPDLQRLTNKQLQAKTREFRHRLRDGETLDDIQAEAFAVVREAAKRTLGMRHFDVQIIGGAVLHDGAISEMKTGEGKTLVSTLAVLQGLVQVAFSTLCHCLTGAKKTEESVADLLN
ncbi:hypothetical protein KI387_015446 [Taxus chinensis]|uniref:chloroplast protein-transporting ATPase n=1 Tax=Taxus chinensis TaxID=29808 RepID=A0AA38GFH9_TAXCH|nr:hypothetical protein KI387_015446 [Taxus chinensis]